jgi:hypothetical protein
MREDPDVILVGELRDAETISMAMTAAETGHLVLGTLHTTSAVKTIDRMIDALPIEEREQTKSFLSQSLIAVITQVLVKRPADGRGRRAVCEVMVMNRAIAQAHHDRADAPDPGAAADRPRGRHADCSTRPCSKAVQARAARPGRRLRLRHRQEAAGQVRHRPQPDCQLRRGRRAAAAPACPHRLAAEEVLRRNGSDLHFMAGEPPRIRRTAS